MGGKVEIIAQNLRDAQIIEACGGQRIELVSAPELGGLTPSGGLLKSVLQHVRIPVQVMIRPKAHSFVYSADELAVMCEDIRLAQASGASGVVLGALTPQGEVDRSALETLLAAVVDCSVTFHRAIDAAADPLAAVGVLQQYSKIKRILSSGGAGAIVENVETLRAMRQAAGNEIKLLLGGGVTRQNMRQLLAAVGSDEVHLGTDVRRRSSYACDLDRAALETVVKAAAQAFEADGAGR
ncbi:copper homeostasis protein CutC [Azotosporobacter soli]|uniref:copper homeostasis protein CutC n=1 Tax=Azotosporobacter soli TaxID=3055040 RepID=UPI0031FF1441